MQKIRFFETNGYHSADCAKREVSSLRTRRSPDGKVEIVANPLNIPKHDPLEEEIQAFVRAVKTGMPPPVTGEEGRPLRIGVDPWLHTISEVSAYGKAGIALVPVAQNPSALLLRVSRDGDAVEVRYSLDGANYIMLRLAHLTLEDRVMVGPMAASPDGDGFSVRFEGLKIEPA